MSAVRAVATVVWCRPRTLQTHAPTTVALSYIRATSSSFYHARGTFSAMTPCEHLRRVRSPPAAEIKKIKNDTAVPPQTLGEVLYIRRGALFVSKKPQPGVCYEVGLIRPCATVDAYRYPEGTGCKFKIHVFVNVSDGRACEDVYLELTHYSFGVAAGVERRTWTKKAGLEAAPALGQNPKQPPPPPHDFTSQNACGKLAVLPLVVTGGGRARCR